MNEGVRVVAVLLVLSFAIERLAAGLMFALSMLPGSLHFLPDPESLKADQRARAEKRATLLRFLLAASFAILSVKAFPSVRVLALLGLQQNQRLDALLTALVRVAGADKVADVLKGQGTSTAKSEPPPIKVTGTLTLDDGTSTPPAVRDKVG